MPEQLRFQKVFGDRGAVQSDERLVFAVTHLVDRFGGDLFSGPRFAEDQHGAVGPGDAADQFHHLPDDLGPADHVAETVRIGQDRLQRLVLPCERALAGRFADDRQQFLDLERFGNEIFRPQFNRFHRRLQFFARGQHDHREFRFDLFYLLERFDPVHSRHPQVEQDDLEVPFFDLFQSFGAGGGGAGGIFLLEDRLERLLHVSFVVNYEHVYFFFVCHVNHKNYSMGTSKMGRNI